MVKWRTGSDHSAGSKYLDQPGTYHMIVMGIDENPTKRDGGLIDNAFFRASLTVLAGTVDGQKDKTVDLLFFYPKEGSKDGGAFATKQIDRFFIATGLIQEGQTDTDVDLNLQKACGRQIVAKLELDQDGKHLRLSYADVWHVDDPACKAIPKNEESLRLLPTSQRLVGKKASKPKAAAATAKAAVDEFDI